MHYLDFMEMIEERYSVRSFDPRPVDPYSLQRILHAGHCAPTTRDIKPQRILVIQSPEGMEKIKRCTSNHFNAPLILLLCYDKKESLQRPFDNQESGFIDAATVGTYMILQAMTEEVGSNWVIAFNPEAVYEEFSLPRNLIPVALIPMGYPSADSRPVEKHGRTRLIEETVFYI